MDAPVRILVVDDDHGIRETLAKLLGEEGFGVDVASNGRQALEWLQAHPGQISLVLLDLMMPTMDGLTFLSIKESDPALMSTPVVVMTAGHRCADVLRRHSVRACLTKPFPLLRLLMVLGSLRP
jgi:CheY-like chemotaxis protein